MSDFKVGDKVQLIIDEAADDQTQDELTRGVITDGPGYYKDLPTAFRMKFEDGVYGAVYPDEIELQENADV